MIAAGAMDRRVQVMRSTATDDGLQQTETWATYGGPLWASFQPVRDTEKWAAGQVQATSMARFVLRWSALTDSITPRDRLLCEGREWSIVGTKTLGRREAVELTATASSD